MTLAPVIFGNIFNLLYGRIYDSHSVTDDDSGDMICHLGVACYASAYWITFVSALGGIGLVAYSIWHENRVYQDGKGKTRHRA